MTTRTELVNAALRRVGAKRIADITENVGAAGIASDIYTNELVDLLRAGTWNFATTRANLAPLTVVPVFEFDHAFALPSDYLRLIGVYDNEAGDGQATYKLESILTEDDTYILAILADLEQIFIRYVRLVTDPNQMTSNFQNCLILSMAKVFAVSSARSTTLLQLLDKELTSAISEARGIDGIEDMIDQPTEGTWALGRRGRWRWGARTSWDWPP